MLGRIKDLNKRILEIKQQKWQIEEKILKLEARLNALEKFCTKRFPRTDKKQLSFTDVKIEEIENLLSHIAAHLDKNVDQEKKAELSDVNKQFRQLISEYKDTIDKLIDPVKEATDTYKTIRKADPQIDLHDLSYNIRTCSDINEKIASIAELDGLVTLPLLIELLEDIRNINAKAIYEAYNSAFGRKLAADTKLDLEKGSTIADLWKYFGINVKSSFEKLTAKPVKDLKPTHVSQLMDKLSADLCNKFHEKFKTEIKSDDSYFKLMELLKTDIYLLCVLETYKFTDELQMGGVFARVRFATRMYLNDVINPYIAVSYCASAVKPIPDTENLFCELVYLLKGLYLRSYNLIPYYLKDGEKVTNQGYLYIGDEEDADLFKYQPPLTKIRMADNHKSHFEALAQKLPAEKLRLAIADNKNSETSKKPAPVLGKDEQKTDQSIAVKPGEQTASSPPKGILTALLAAEKNAAPSVPPSVEELEKLAPLKPIEIREDNDYYRMTISVRNDELDKYKRLMAEIGKVMEEGILPASPEMQNQLRKYQNHPVDVKIEKLKECIRIYKWSNQQISSVSSFIPLLVQHYFTEYSSGVRYGVFANKHAAAATKIMEEINAENDPKVQLEKLLVFRKKLSKPGDVSTRLLPHVESILLAAYQVLSKGLDNDNDLPAAPIAIEESHEGSEKLQYITGQNYSQIKVKLPRNEAERWFKLNIVVGKIMEHGVSDNENKMIEQLTTTADKDLNEKLKNLTNCIRMYSLSREQQSALKLLGRSVNDKFKPYLERRVLLGMWKSKHHALAETTKNEITETLDPKIRLEKLFKLRKTLMAEKESSKSQNLLPIVNEILLGAYDSLMEPLPQLTHTNSGR